MVHVLSAYLDGKPAGHGLTYKWVVSPGTITDGQGGSSVTVEMPECECDFRVVLEVGGLPPGCRASQEWGINDLCFYPISTGRYGDVSADEEKALLSRYVGTLKLGQCWHMQLTAHGGEGGRIEEVLVRAERARKYLIEEHGVEGERVTVVRGEARGKREIEVYVSHGQATGKASQRR